MEKVLDLIRDGDLRSVAGTAEAAAKVRAEPKRLTELLELLNHPEPAVRMRAADALEKASAHNEALLTPHKALLLEEAHATAQKELRWHFAQLLPRLNLDSGEVLDVADLFRRWYARDRSAIVRTFVLQGLADLARKDGRLIGPALELVRAALDSEVPSLKARARKLKVGLENLKAQQRD